MNCAIFYFSGTNNTKMVCQKSMEEFNKNNIECNIYDICKTDITDLSAYDFVGFAYPIHGFNAPYVMYDFIKKLKKCDNKKFFILKTSGEPVKMNNASSYKIRHLLKKKGINNLTNEYHYVMPYNMIFRHSDLDAKKMWDTAKALIEVETKEIINNTPHLLKRPFMGHFVAWIVRIEHPFFKIHGKHLKITDKCIGCNMCVNNCPVNNIEKTENGFKFSNKCIMCTRCSFTCPVDAFKIGILNKWRVNGKYNFENPDLTKKCKKPNYCKKAYARYYKEAEEKISNV